MANEISPYEIEEMILNKITKTIRDNFTTTEVLGVHNDKVVQNFNKPAIVVIEYDEMEQHLGNNWARYYVWFDITIHIEINATTMTGLYPLMRKYGAKLSRILDYITLEAQYTNGAGTIKLKKHEWRVFVKDDVGHCMVGYDFVGSTQIKDDTRIPIDEVRGKNYLDKERGNT